MACFVAQDDREWTILVLTHEIECEIGRHIIDPALGWSLDTIDFHGAIEVDALTDEACREVEAGAFAGLGAHVPFADVSGFVTGLSHQGSVREAFDGEGGVVVDHTVDVPIASGQKGGSARCAQGCDDESLAESETLAGQSV